MKMKPKSCMCHICRMCKSNERPKFKTRTFEERAFRRATKMALRGGDEVIAPAPHGAYIG